MELILALMQTEPDKGVPPVSTWSQSIGQKIMEYGPKALGAFLFVLAAWLVSEWARRLTVRLLHRAHVETTLAKFLGNIARWGLLILALIACLGIFGVQTASYAAVIGSAGLAIGLAM